MNADMLTVLAPTITINQNFNVLEKVLLMITRTLIKQDDAIFVIDIRAKIVKNKSGWSISISLKTYLCKGVIGAG